MAGTINFGIRLTADGDAFVGGVRVAKGEFDKLVGGIEQGTKRAAAASESLNSSLKTFAGIGAGAFGISEVTRYAKALADTADAASMIRSRLQLVAGTTQNTAQVYSELFRIAQASRVSFEDLAGTYSQIARSSAEAGISQERLLKVTQTLSQAITVSGGSAASTQAAMVQLSQGLASGTLRGEELNSILEQTPRVAQAIAQGLGVGIGQLRKLGEEGKLTSKAVVEAIEKSAPAIATEFQRMTPTIGQAFTQLGNSGLNLVGTLDKMAGASTGVATGLGKMATGVDGFAKSIQDNPIVMAYLKALQFAAGGGVAGAAYRYATRGPDAPPTPDRNAAFSDSRFEVGQAEIRRQAALGGLADRRLLSRDQQRLADIQGVRSSIVETMGGLGDNPSEEDLERVRAALRQGVANVEDRYKDRGATGTARTAATDRRQSIATQLAEERRAVEDQERRDLRREESRARQGIIPEEQLARERRRIQLESITGQEEVARRQLDLAGADLSERARANAELAKLASERQGVEEDYTNRFAELVAQRAQAAEEEARGFRLVRFNEAQSIRDSIAALADETTARQRSILTGRSEAEMLRELKIARVEAELAVDERPDPEKVARLELLREELRLLRERADLAEDRRGLTPTGGRGGPERTEIDELRSAIEGFGRSSSKAFADYLLEGRSSFVAVREAFKRELLEMVAFRTVIGPLFGTGSKGGGGSSGLLGDLIGGFAQSLLGGSMQVGGAGGGILEGGSLLAATGDLIRGRRALGGPVDAGGTYLVGEEGPELLRMGKQGGSITPNPATAARMGGGSITLQVTNNFDFSNSIGVREVVEMAAQQGAQKGSQLALDRVADATRRNDPRYTG